MLIVSSQPKRATSFLLCHKFLLAHEKNKHCGNNSHFGTFSFASTKIFTSVSGGAVVHNDPKIHDLIIGYTNCGKRIPFGEFQGLWGVDFPLCSVRTLLGFVIPMSSLPGLDLEFLTQS